MNVKTIKFHGNLKEEFGDEIKVIGDSVYLIISYLRKKFKNFRSFTQKDKYYFFDGKENISINKVHERLESNEIDILPVLEGSEPLTIGTAILIGAIILAAALVLSFFMMPEMNGGAEGNASYMFNGSVNVSEQGLPAPVLCGICRYGSIVISNGVYPEELENYDLDVGVPVSRENNKVI